MNRKYAVVLGFVLTVCVFISCVPLETLAQDRYSFFSQKGTIWQYEVTMDSGDKTILTIVNEGGVSFNSTMFSWTFKNAIGISVRMELFYQRSSDGTLLTRVDTYTGSHLTLSQSYNPPVLALKLPLRTGYWEHRGLRVSAKGEELYNVTNTVRKAGITVPAGTFVAFEIQGQELDGSKAIEYWVQDVGLVAMVEKHASGRGMRAELVRFWPSIDAMLAVGTKVFLHRPVWGCLTAEALAEVYRLQARASYDQEAAVQLEYVAQQRQCVQIHNLKGYVVHRKGDAANINNLSVNNQSILIWVPLWSLTPCLGVVCR
ncbi:MAG: hypothetical protein AAB975_03985 [Patescibacteria group bacterium]